MNPADVTSAAALREGLRSEAAATPKGSARALAILEETLAVIAEQGHRALTLDEVAGRVGIARGNLQYYFPTRDDLLRAAFAEQIARHKCAWRAVAEAPAPDARTRLERLIAFEIAANRNSSLVAQVRERWSLARDDAAMLRLGNDWYRWVTVRYARIVAELRPDIDARSCRQVAMTLYAMLVGAAPYHCDGGALPEFAAGLDERLTAAAFGIVAAA